MLPGMKARQIMTTPVVTVAAMTPLGEIARVLVRHRISGVPVVGESGELLGIVTEADLVVLEAPPAPKRRWPFARPRAQKERRTAADVMTKDVITVSEDALVSEIAAVMVRRGVKRVPVVAAGKVVGIVSRRELIAILMRSDDEIAAEVQELLDDVIKVIGRYRASVSGGVVTLTGSTDRQTAHLAEATARSVPGVIAVTFE